MKNRFAPPGSSRSEFIRASIAVGLSRAIELAGDGQLDIVLDLERDRRRRPGAQQDRQAGRETYDWTSRFQSREVLT